MGTGGRKGDRQDMAVGPDCLPPGGVRCGRETGFLRRPYEFALAGPEAFEKGDR